MGAPPKPVTREVLRQRLELVYDWYAGMVDPSTGLLGYIYLPEQESFVRMRSPIREIASVWDAAVLGAFLGRRELDPLLTRSLRHYRDYIVARDRHAIVDPERLEEPASIAHSAFMILALLHAPAPDAARNIAALAEGLLQQQRDDGSYKVYFDDLPDQGEELYAGEAMLALMEAYRRSHDERCLRSVERAAEFYDREYFRRGRVDDDVLLFFANWQSQACRALFECTRDMDRRRRVAAYVGRQHDMIIARGFYAAVERHPERQVCVAVACALEGLNDAYAILPDAAAEPRERYRRCICAGLRYLLALQSTGEGGARERGGFGMSLQERAQRIDVTGHAASAFMKALGNGIDCDTAAHSAAP
jgi:hypothetical protein